MVVWGDRGPRGMRWLQWSNGTFSWFVVFELEDDGSIRFGMMYGVVPHLWSSLTQSCTRLRAPLKLLWPIFIIFKVLPCCRRWYFCGVLRTENWKLSHPFLTCTQFPQRGLQPIDFCWSHNRERGFQVKSFYSLLTPARPGIFSWRSVWKALSISSCLFCLNYSA